MALGSGEGPEEEKRGSAKMGSQDSESFTPAFVERVVVHILPCGGGGEKDAVRCVLLQVVLLGTMGLVHL